MKVTREIDRKKKDWIRGKMERRAESQRIIRERERDKEREIEREYG